MGIITIKVPKDIKVEYELDSMEETENLIKRLQEIPIKPRTTKPDHLMGLFSDDVELMDQITESAMKAREKDPLRVS